LPTRLAALAVTYEQRGPSPIELKVTPVERAELGAAQPRRDQSEQREPVSLGKAGQVPLGTARGVE
jgi:hypothetical protein